MSDSASHQSPSARPKRRGLSIKRRLLIGTTIALVAMVSAIVISVSGLRQIQERNDESAVVQKSAQELQAIEKNVAHLQRDSLTYSFTGSRGIPPRIRVQGDVLKKQIDDAIKASDSENATRDLREISEHLATFLENFEMVVTERELRMQIVTERLPASIVSLEELLTRMIDRAANEKDQAGPRVTLLQQVYADVTSAENAAFRFLSDPDSRKVAVVRERLKLVYQRLDELDEITTSEDELKACRAELKSFEQNFLRVVQATRGYLYLVSVVMAGEAAEISWLAERLGKLGTTRIQELSATSRKNTAQTTRNASIFAVAAVFVIVLMVFMIGASIFRPITNLTETFTKLSSGDDVDAIPGLDRNDEIGSLAHAADVFRTRNRETEELLNESRELTQQLDERAQELKKSNEDLDSFAYVASHDLKSPLRAIDNLSSWVVEDAAEHVPEDSRKHLGEIRSRVRKMEQLLTDLLDYSRAGRIRTAPGPVDLRQMAVDLQNTIDWPADMELAVPDDTITVVTDRGAISRVLMNLLTNAAKYRSETDARVEVSFEDAGDFVTVSVSDNGPGIAPQYHERVFQMFGRLGLQPEVEGTGMGLALIRKLVESYGGEVSLVSVEGEGAEFSFTWPKTPIPDAQDTPSENEAAV